MRIYLLWENLAVERFQTILLATENFDLEQVKNFPTITSSVGFRPGFSFRQEFSKTEICVVSLYCPFLLVET